MNGFVNIFFTKLTTILMILELLYTVLPCLYVPIPS